MDEIRKLTQAIRNYSEIDLDYGTVVTLSKIDKEAERLETALQSAREERDTFRELNSNAWKQVQAITYERDAAQAEVRRLREEMGKIKRDILEPDKITIHIEHALASPAEPVAVCRCDNCRYDNCLSGNQPCMSCIRGTSEKRVNWKPIVQVKEGE